MRARTIREGSVGLLILVGIGLFGLLILWLRGTSFGQRSYTVSASFEDISGMQVGTPVRYRGVPVGQIVAIRPQTNSVEVELEIAQSDLRMPAGILLETSQSGLIGETSIDITPLEELSQTGLALSPIGPDCNSRIIVCEGDRLEGTQGVSYEDLLRSSKRISDFLADPDIAQDITEILSATNDISTNVTGLTEELTLLIAETRQELGPLAASARQATVSTARAAQQVELSAAQTTAKLDTTLTEINQLLTNNRGDIVATLNNLRSSSEQLSAVMNNLAPALQEGELVNNLEQLSMNAAAASADLQAITSRFNTDENLILLQQTLESARDVFQSAQKIMADVDELTGDPAFRTNVRDLVNGLSGLVSSTEQLESQAELASLINRAHLQAEQTAPPVASKIAPHNAGELSPEERPVLVFDGQRYTLRLADGSPLPAAQP
ncbi:MAG: MCE family protein [Leptolyngbya sp. SIO4C1]|nr:MCE family protein [Leptolyngbya sp. SIO4C1]